MQCIYSTVKLRSYEDKMYLCLGKILISEWLFVLHDSASLHGDACISLMRQQQDKMTYKTQNIQMYESALFRLSVVTQHCIFVAVRLQTTLTVKNK